MKKMTKKKLLTYTLLPVIGLALVGANIASAHGFGWFQNVLPEEIAERQRTMFEHKADLLGIGVEEVKQSWAEGKSFMEIAEANGITEEELRNRMQEMQKAKMIAQLQSFVDNDVITQAQADQRLKFMETRAESGKWGGRGFHRGWRL